MAKYHAKHAFRKSIYIILGLSLMVAFSYTVYRSYLRPSTPADVFLIEPVALTYGSTELVGVIQDGASGFILVLPDTHVITLDVQGLETLIASKVKVTGNLVKAINASGNDSMQVQTIQVLP